MKIILLKRGSKDAEAKQELRRLEELSGLSQLKRGCLFTRDLCHSVPPVALQWQCHRLRAKHGQNPLTVHTCPNLKTCDQNKLLHSVDHALHWSSGLPLLHPPALEACWRWGPGLMLGPWAGDGALGLQWGPGLVIGPWADGGLLGPAGCSCPCPFYVATYEMGRTTQAQDL